MAGGAAATAPTTLLQDSSVRPVIALTEEEIADVSLATFYIFDKENESQLGQGIRLAQRCGRCGGGGGSGGAAVGGAGRCGGGGCAAARCAGSGGAGSGGGGAGRCGGGGCAPARGGGCAGWGIGCAGCVSIGFGEGCWQPKSANCY